MVKDRLENTDNKDIKSKIENSVRYLQNLFVS